MGFLQNLFGKSDNKNQPANQPDIPPLSNNQPNQSTDPVDPQPSSPSDNQFSASKPISAPTTPGTPSTTVSQPTTDLSQPSAGQDTFAPDASSPSTDLPTATPKPTDGLDIDDGLPEVPKVDEVPGASGVDEPSAPGVPEAPKPLEGAPENGEPK